MVKTILGQVKQYKLASILTPVFAASEVVMEILIPMMMANLIDEGINAGNMQFVIKDGIIMVLMAACSLTFGILAGKQAARASTGLACNLRESMYGNIQTFSFANIDKYSTAGLITRMTTDVTNVQNSYQMILRMCTRAPMTLICSMIMAFYISRSLSMVFVAAIVFLAVVLAIIMMNAAKMFQKGFKKYDDLNSDVQENVSAIRVVKAFVREDFEKKKFNRSADEIYRIFVKAESCVVFNNPVMMLAVYASMLAISWMGAKMIVGGTLTTGQLASLITYIMSIMMSLMMLSMIFVMVTMSFASANRVTEIINEKATLTDPENPVTEIPDGSVEFDNVSFSYKKGSGKPVLDDVSFSVRSGEVIGIIGGTGSAKSTLVSLISRLYDVTGGTVKVGGRDVREYSMEALRDAVSVVLQKNELFSGTVLDNLRWGNKNASEEECRKACSIACADEFIDRMPDGYETMIEQGGANISGGQKQRLCIARALLKKPKILILDDSTSAVDTATDGRIRRAFREEIPDTTKFIIAQRISSVQNADRIIVLKDGRIDGFGTHEELMENEIYRTVYESQTQGSGDFDKLEA
jgi:ATP-binding cassette subfamily B multidrug efflux pump